MITIISGTNRPNSNTLKVAKYYQQQLSERGISSQLLDLRDLPDNFTGNDLYGERSSAFLKIQQQIIESDKFLFIIPEYNGSYPGILKVFIDACAFPDSFYDKKACLVGISSGRYGNVRGIDHFNGVCAYLHLHVMPLRLHIANIKSELDADARFFKEDTIKFTTEQIDKFARF